MPRSSVVLSEGRIEVEGTLERVVSTLLTREAQLNRAEEGSEPDWVWINQAQVLYVEAADTESVYEQRG